MDRSDHPKPMRQHLLAFRDSIAFFSKVHEKRMKFSFFLEHVVPAHRKLRVHDALVVYHSLMQVRKWHGSVTSGRWHKHNRGMLGGPCFEEFLRCS